MNIEYKLYDLKEEIEKYSSKDTNIHDEQTNLYNKHKVREDFCNLLQNTLHISTLEATDLEIGVFNCTIDYSISNKIQLSWKCLLFIDTYINIARSIYSNLKSDSYVGNTELLKRMVEYKEFNPHMLPYMQSHNIFPERWKSIIDKNNLRIKEAYEFNIVAMSDMITCMRCKSKKVSYYELQTRSGDEASTLFMECLICGKKWKQ
jgi:DNA-directed RNA polymerase subunit M/transcription elongation factor TFIIS